VYISSFSSIGLFNAPSFLVELLSDSSHQMEGSDGLHITLALDNSQPLRKGWQRQHRRRMDFLSTPVTPGRPDRASKPLEHCKSPRDCFSIAMTRLDTRLYRVSPLSSLIFPYWLRASARLRMVVDHRQGLRGHRCCGLEPRSCADWILGLGCQPW